MQIQTFHHLQQDWAFSFFSQSLIIIYEQIISAWQQTGGWRDRVLTYMLLPKMHCGWQLLPGSSGPRRRRLPRPVCSVVHEQCEGRKVSQWEAACGEIVCHLCQFPPALHPCTTPLLGPAALLLYSWEWQAPLWTQPGQRGAPQFGVGSLPDADGILKEKGDMQLIIRKHIIKTLRLTYIKLFYWIHFCN